MGGNALKHTLLYRRQAADYFKLKEYVLQCFSKAGVVVRVPLEVPGKFDFGDLDILHTLEKDTLPTLIHTLFAPSEVVYNGPYTSFNITNAPECTNFQIDLVFTNDMDMSFFYLSYGDVGGILGWLANAYGLKFGMDGLWCFCNPLNILERDMTTTLVRLDLSHSPQAILTFLGGDYAVWQQGFTTEQALFTWLVAFKRLTPDMFQVLNHAHRVRQQKRPMYARFLRYLGVDPIQAATTYVGECVYNLQPLAVEFFQQEPALFCLQQEAVQCAVRHAKFNGNLFHGEGKIRGMTIQAFKAAHTIDNSFEAWLDQCTASEVQDTITKFELSTFKLSTVCSTVK